MATDRNEEGYIYLLHFDRKVTGHSQHYMGFTTDLPARLDEHAKGHGARLMEVVAERDIGWTMVRSWYGTPLHERRLKNHKNHSRMCPLCNPTGWHNHVRDLTDYLTVHVIGLED